MSNDINIHLPMITNNIGIKCILVNPDKFVKEYTWIGGDIWDLIISIEWGSIVDLHDLRKKDILDYSILYYDDDYFLEESPSIFLNETPVCYGPCMIFNKGLESLDDDDIKHICDKKYLYTYDGKTGLCIKLE